MKTLTWRSFLGTLGKGVWPPGKLCRRASRSLGRKVKEISSEILITLISPSHPILHLGQRVGKTFPPAKGDSSTKKGRTNLCLQPLEGRS